LTIGRIILTHKILFSIQTIFFGKQLRGAGCGVRVAGHSIADFGFRIDISGQAGMMVRDALRKGI
jgi:hypothetical protein